MSSYLFIENKEKTPPFGMFVDVCCIRYSGKIIYCYTVLVLNVGNSGIFSEGLNVS